MKTIYKLIIVLLVIALIAMFIFPDKLQEILTGIIGAITALLFKGKADTKRYKDEAEKLQKEKEKIETEVDDLRKKAHEIKQSGDDRQEEVQKIEDRIKELKKKDWERTEKANKLTNRMKKFLLVMLLIPGIIFATNFCGDVVLAEEVNIPEPEELNITIDDIKIPDNYDELLEQHKEALKLMISFQKLYFDEREDKLEAIELAEEMKTQYEEEKADREELYELFSDLSGKVDRLELIIETQNELVMDVIDDIGNDNPFGLYGGIGYSPFEPLSSSVDVGVTFDF